MWALLQSSTALVQQLFELTRTHGPLSCLHAPAPGYCLRDGQGQWVHGGTMPLIADERARLALLWRQSARAQREFVVHATVGRVPALAPAGGFKEGKLWPHPRHVQGQPPPSLPEKTLQPECYISLAACHVDPLRPHDEIARLLRAGTS